MEQIIELKRPGYELIGSDRKTIRKYLKRLATPVYGRGCRDAASWTAIPAKAEEERLSAKIVVCCPAAAR